MEKIKRNQNAVKRSYIQASRSDIQRLIRHPGQVCRELQERVGEYQSRRKGERVSISRTTAPIHNGKVSFPFYKDGRHFKPGKHHDLHRANLMGTIKSLNALGCLTRDTRIVNHPLRIFPRLDTEIFKHPKSNEDRNERTCCTQSPCG